MCHANWSMEQPSIDQFFVRVRRVPSKAVMRCCSGAIFLASDEAPYVTGVILPIDGGYTCV